MGGGGVPLAVGFPGDASGQNSGLALCSALGAGCAVLRRPSRFVSRFVSRSPGLLAAALKDSGACRVPGAARRGRPLPPDIRSNRESGRRFSGQSGPRF